MNSRRVHLRGQEHLPPFLKNFADDSYQYSAHKHTVETTKDGILHTYSVVLSQYPLKGQKTDDDVSESESRGKSRKTARQPEKGDEQLVSQIKSTTTSEMNRSPPVSTSNSSASGDSTVSRSSNSFSSSIRREHQYLNLTSMSASNGSAGPRANVRPLSSSQTSQSSSDSAYSNLEVAQATLKDCIRPLSESEQSSKSSGTSSASQSFGTSSSRSKTSLPKFTYSTGSSRSTRSAKYVMMVHVKFLLLHRDVFHRRVQSMFTDEFPSDCLLEDVIYNFHQLCTRQLRNNDFNPRLSYCIGELNQANSKPVLIADMRKTLAELAKSNSIIKFALIVDNIND